MEQNEDLSPAIEDVLEAVPDEASLRRQVTDLLLGGSRDVRLGLWTLEQSDVLQKIEAALEAYGTYFYPPEHR
jgi:radical SAM superfamily enzyme